jgi:hypothetical protein
MPRTAAVARSSRRGAWVAAPLAALTLLAVSACGSGTHQHGNSAARLAFTQCLSAHGVTLPHRTPGSGGSGAHPAGQRRDPSVAPAGVNQQTWDSARAACASTAPTPPSTAGS